MPPGRPKKQDGVIRSLDVRLTPKEGEIDFDPTEEDFKVFIACREGGLGTDKQLHYHIYCETLRSDTWLTKFWYRLTKYDTPVGNKAFKQRPAHENTIGYVVKEGHVVCRLGTSDQFINEWYERSKQYRSDLEADRKKKQRHLKKTLDSIFKEVIAQVPLDVTRPYSTYATGLIAGILDKYTEFDLRFPPRSQIDNIVSKHLYSIDEYRYDVLRLYSRSFNPYN